MVSLTFSDAELESQREHIASFIAAQCEAAGVEGAVLGLSGGIDSTLTAYLAVEAIGPEAVHGLLLPSAVSSTDSVTDAERVVEALGITHTEVTVEPVVDALLEAYPDAADDHEAVGNARARVRAVLGYLVANHENRLVVGTGNRSEAAVGYFTKYGDGGVDCHPIGNLYKAQVRQLAAHVGVPEDLVEKTPTAELWDDQTDEAELGMDYDTLDGVLALHVDGPLSPAATARELGVDRAVVERVRELYEASAHKRAVPPSPPPLE